METETPRSAEVEQRPRERLDALGRAPRAELLHVLMLPDFDRDIEVMDSDGSNLLDITPDRCLARHRRDLRTQEDQ